MFFYFPEHSNIVLFATVQIIEREVGFFFLVPKETSSFLPFRVKQTGFFKQCQLSFCQLSSFFFFFFESERDLTHSFREIESRYSASELVVVIPPAKWAKECATKLALRLIQPKDKLLILNIMRVDRTYLKWFLCVINFVFFLEGR